MATTGQRWERLANGQIWRRYELADNKTVGVWAPVNYEWCRVGSTSTLANSGPDQMTNITAVGSGSILARTTSTEAHKRMSWQLTAANEQQILYAHLGDELPIRIGAGDTNTRYTQFETRILVKTLPSDIQVETFWGLGSVYPSTGDRDVIARRVGFGLTGSVGSGGGVSMHSDDGVTVTIDKLTTTTLVAGDKFRTYRIDCSTPSDVKFYIDGVLVNNSVTFDMSGLVAASTDAFQPTLMLSKHIASTGVGEFLVDYTRCWGLL